jgi:hypothetical protein
MATLIQLTFPVRKPAPAAASRPHGKSAEVIIFPGVRYERHAVVEVEKPKRKRKSRAKAAKQILIAR